MAVEQILVITILYLITKKKVIESPTSSNKLQKVFLIFLIYSLVLLKNYFDSKLPNVYQILEIPRTSSNEEIRESYKQVLKYKHPDKSKSPNAEEEFRELKRNYDFVRTNEVRVKYEKLAGVNENVAFGNSIGFYVGWIFVCNSLYFSKVPRAGRNLLCLVSITGILESYAMTQLLFYFNFYLLPLTVFEQIQIIQTLFPPLAFLMMCIEGIKTYEKEQELKNKLAMFYEGEGKSVIEIIKNKKSSEVVEKYLNSMKMAAAKKHQSNTLGNLIYLALVAYMLFGRGLA